MNALEARYGYSKRDRFHDKDGNTWELVSPLRQDDTRPGADVAYALCKNVRTGERREFIFPANTFTN